MPGFNGTGPRGMGPMTGGGRGFCSPGAGRFQQFGMPRYGRRRFWQAAPQPTREQEIEMLKGQAGSLRQELDSIETEINRLSGE